MPHPMPETDEVLATVSASAPRRIFGIGTMVCLGALLLYLAFAFPIAIFWWQAFVGVCGLGALWMAARMKSAARRVVVLTGQGLHDSEGEVIATLDDIKSLERGVFAMKPSNGFLIRLRRAAPRRWYPGIWWRFGKSVGIGGVTPGPQTKAMVQMLEALLAEKKS